MKKMDVDEKSQQKRPNVAQGGGYMNGGTMSDEEKVLLDKYDTEAQERLLEEGLAVSGNERAAYERFLEVFPTAGSVWNRYVQREMEQRQYDYVDELLKRCLISSLNVELWMTYLKYVVDATMSSSKGPMERKSKIRDCYDYALSHIGMDMGANVVWEDYIAWLKRESYDPSTICEVYFRALSTPMHKLDAIWRDYEKFTEKLSRSNTNEVSAKYSTSKRVYEERIRLTEGLNKNTLARPPRNVSADLHQARLWKHVIDFEKSNPQDLGADQLSARITFTYNQSLIDLYHYPEIWHQAAQYQLSIGKTEDAKRLYAMALSVLPNCLLIHFQFCDFLELHNFGTEAEAVYRNLTTHFAQNELVWIQYMYFARRTSGIPAARKVFFKARKQATASYHIYIAAAQLEYYVNKDTQVARNVYELGYHQFERNPVFLKHYVDFLFHQSGEDSHMRVLFEKILANVRPSQSLELWNRFLDFETVCGNLEPAYKLQSRRTSAFPGLDPSGSLASVQRYRFLDLWPCSADELASLENDFDISNLDEVEEESDANAENQGEAAQAEQLMTMPDLKQMQLYKGTGAPGQVASSSTLSIRLDDLMIKLPSAKDWSGPMVNTELLMQSILNFIDIPLVAGPSKYSATRADEEEESGLQARARESAMANDVFRKRVSKSSATTSR